MALATIILSAKELGQERLTRGVSPQSAREAPENHSPQRLLRRSCKPLTVSRAASGRP